MEHHFPMIHSANASKLFDSKLSTLECLFSGGCHLTEISFILTWHKRMQCQNSSAKLEPAKDANEDTTSHSLGI